MEENQNGYNENEQNNIEPAIRSGRPTRRERINKKAKEIMKIVGSVIGHQLKITLLISAIALILIIVLSSVTLYVLQQNSIEDLLKLFSM